MGGVFLILTFMEDVNTMDPACRQRPQFACSLTGFLHPLCFCYAFKSIVVLFLLWCVFSFNKGIIMVISKLFLELEIFCLLNLLSGY